MNNGKISQRKEIYDVKKINTNGTLPLYDVIFALPRNLFRS